MGRARCHRCRSPLRGSLHGTRMRSHSASIFRSLPQTSVVGQQTHRRTPSRVLSKSRRVASPSDIAPELRAICITGLLSFCTRRVSRVPSHTPPTGGFPLPSPPTSRAPSSGAGPALLCRAFRKSCSLFPLKLCSVD